MQILYSHSRRKHYAAAETDRRAYLGYLYPTLCGQNGMTADEFVRHYTPSGGDPADHPMCKRCERKAAKTS